MTVSFGVLLLQNRALSEVTAWAQRFDEAGADSVWVADHLFYPYGPDEPWLDPWITLASIAERTDDCRIGPLVTTFLLQSPVGLARRAQTLDLLSGGRLDLGIGAGGSPLDRGFTGIEDRSHRDLVDRLDDGLDVLATALRGDRLAVPPTPTIAGRQAPADVILAVAEHAPSVPPIVVGGQSRAVLDVAARRADRWNGAGAGVWGPGGLEGLRRASGYLDERCALHGRDPRSVTRSVILDLTPETSAATPAELGDVIGNVAALGFREFIAFGWGDGIVDRPTERLLDFVGHDLQDVRQSL